MSAAFIAPVGATEETADNGTTITISELVSWIESTISQQTEAVKNVVSVAIEELSLSGDNGTDDEQQPDSDRDVVDSDDEQQPDSDRDVVDSDDDKTPNDRGCHPNHTETSKTSKRSVDTAGNDSTDCSGTDGEKTTTTNNRTTTSDGTSDSSPNDQDEHTNEGETTSRHEGDSGVNSTDTTHKHSTTSRTGGKHTVSTTHSTHEMGNESPDETTSGVNSGPSQGSKFESNIPEADALPNINSPIIALIGAFCVISGLVSIARRLN
ncbi:hypothetical protein [Haladaptatus sp. R4]|uniref:hypothetical protein n=1 Tax=Haladaptatus sp. R4 TaxID=1679489 RepID=UPI0012374739|nr:hypothetical protein [Haladaptatus sp. R4]